MRVAFLVGRFPAISETFVLRQILGVIDRGHEVEIYALERGVDAPDVLARYGLNRRVRYLDLPASMGARLRHVARAGARLGRAPMLYARALNVLRFGRMALSLRLTVLTDQIAALGPRCYDVIHCQFGPLGTIAVRLRRIGAWDGAIVTAFRGYDATELLKRSPHRYDDLFRDGDLFLPVSAALAESLRAHGCDPAKLLVHHSGIDCRSLTYRPRMLAPAERVRLVSVARLVEKKGIGIAIRAVAGLVARGYNVEYNVVGDGPERAALLRLIEQLDLGARIRLAGACSHAETLAALDRAHILLAPSVTAANGDQEGIPNALKEAMALGLPVVATRHGGNAELVQDGVSGILVPERDVNALADGIARLIDTHASWPAMASAGRHKVEADFDAARLSAELNDIYARVVDRRAHPGTMYTASGRGCAPSEGR